MTEFYIYIYIIHTHNTYNIHLYIYIQTKNFTLLQAIIRAGHRLITLSDKPFVLNRQKKREAGKEKETIKMKFLSPPDRRAEALSGLQGTGYPMTGSSACCHSCPPRSSKK